MGRPKFWQCIMTPEIIHHIIQEQEIYDRDPKKYEEEKRQEQERYIQEQEELNYQYRLDQERENEQYY